MSSSGELTTEAMIVDADLAYDDDDDDDDDDDNNNNNDNDFKLALIPSNTIKSMAVILARFVFQNCLLVLGTTITSLS